MVVVGEEVEVVLVVAVAVVVAVINKVAGMALVTLQVMRKTKVSSASTVYG